MMNDGARSGYLLAGPHGELQGPHGGAMRAVVMGRMGVVSSAHWLASQEASRMLRDGGNAFDAAVCAAAVVSVSEPYMSGIGGSGGAVCFDAASGTPRALDFHAFAPAAAAPDRWRQQNDLLDDIGAALVPGVVAGWAAIVESYGTMSLESLLEPAARCAESGVPASILCSHQIASHADRLRRNRAAARVFLPGGRPPRPGETIVQKELAATLRAIGRDGAETFYEGPIAGALADGCAQEGGLITRDDLRAALRLTWTDTAFAAYRGSTVHTLPPPYASFQVLETLRILDGFDLATLGHNSADHLHLLIESIKLARADRVGFSAHDVDATYSALLADHHVQALRSRIDRTCAAASAGDRYESGATLRPKVPSQHTTHLTTADTSGNLVSLTQTLGWYFGTGVMVGDTGVLLNDMLYFGDLARGSPNVIAPRKKIVSPIAPTMTQGPTGAPWISVGTPGGHGILQTTVQMLSNVIDFGMNPQAALEAARIRVDEGRYVAAESRITREDIANLERRGHECHDMGEWMHESRPGDGRDDIGRGAMVIRDSRTNVLLGGSDPRGDGFALAY